MKILIILKKNWVCHTCWWRLSSKLMAWARVPSAEWKPGRHRSRCWWFNRWNRHPSPPKHTAESGKTRAFTWGIKRVVRCGIRCFKVFSVSGSLKKKVIFNWKSIWFSWNPFIQYTIKSILRKEKRRSWPLAVDRWQFWVLRLEKR